MTTLNRKMQKTRGLLLESTELEQQIADLYLQGLSPTQIEQTVKAHKATVTKAIRRIDKEVQQFSPTNAKSLVVSKFLQFTISHGVINKALAIELTKLDHDIRILYALNEETVSLTAELSITKHNDGPRSDEIRDRLKCIEDESATYRGTAKARAELHKQIIANNKSYADIMHKMGVSALAPHTISNGSHPPPENNISKSSADEDDIAAQLRAAADRIERHEKSNIKSG